MPQTTDTTTARSATHCCPNCATPLALNNEVTGELYCPACLVLFDPDDDCGDCGRPVVYEYGDAERYRHATDPERGCFLIPAEPAR